MQIRILKCPRVARGFIAETVNGLNPKLGFTQIQVKPGIAIFTNVLNATDALKQTILNGKSNLGKKELGTKNQLQIIKLDFGKEGADYLMFNSTPGLFTNFALAASPEYVDPVSLLVGSSESLNEYVGPWQNTTTFGGQTLKLPNLDQIEGNPEENSLWANITKSREN